MYFDIKDEKLVDKHMKIYEKVNNIIKKKINSDLICNKKYLKAEKNFTTTEIFQCFYIPVILINSVYRNVFLEKLIHNFF